jgi:hypothetical protein
MGFVHAAILRRGFDSVKVGLLFVACLALAACGGGGGGGGSPGSGGSLAVTPTSINFVAQQNGLTPPSQVLTATYSETNVGQVVAGWPVGTTPPPWLTLLAGGSQSSPVTFSVVPSSPTLPVGTYTATVVIGTGTSSGSVISIRNVPVTYEIGTITFTPSSANLTSAAGHPTATGTLFSVTSSRGTGGWVLNGPNYAFGEPTGWLGISFSGPNLPTTMTLTGDATPLAAGTYHATINIGDGPFTGQLAVTYTVTP